MKDFTNDFYGKAAWKKCRASFIAERISKDGGRCQMCGEQGEIVHHVQEIDPDTINDTEVTLNHDNFMYLCRSCHAKAHGREPYMVIQPDGRWAPPIKKI